MWIWDATEVWKSRTVEPFGTGNSYFWIISIWISHRITEWKLNHLSIPTDFQNAISICILSACTMVSHTFKIRIFIRALLAALSYTLIKFSRKRVFLKHFLNKYPLLGSSQTSKIAWVDVLNPNILDRKQKKTSPDNTTNRQLDLQNIVFWWRQILITMLFCNKNATERSCLGLNRTNADLA